MIPTSYSIPAKFVVVFSLMLIAIIGLVNPAEAQNCTVNSGINIEQCENEPLILNGNQAGLFAISNVTQWSQVGGPSVSIVDPTDLQSEVLGVTGGNTYTFRITGRCLDGSLVFQDVEYDILSAGDADAGLDQTYCPGGPYNLSASALGGGETGLWTILGNNPAGVNINDATNPTSSFTLPETSAGTASLVWTVTSANGCAESDTVEIVNRGGELPVDAGANQTLGNCYSISQSTNLSASFGGSGIDGQIGTWSFVSGPNIPTINNVNARNTGVSNLRQGTYVFQWTVTGGCAAGTDNVSITVPAPTSDVTQATISTGVGSGDKTLTICDPGVNEVVVQGRVPRFTGEVAEWVQISGPTAGVTINSPNSAVTTITGLSDPNTYVFRYTIENPTTFCSTSREITIQYNDAPEVNITTPSPLVLACGETTATINFTTESTPNTTEWRILSGPTSASYPSFPTGFSNASGTSVDIPNLTTNGTYIVQLKRSGTPGFNCSAAYDEVTIVTSEEPTISNAGTDQILACNIRFTNLAGNTPTEGVGNWTLVSGPLPVDIIDPSDPTSGVNFDPIADEVNGEYIFRWITSAGPECPNYQDDVSVIVSNEEPQVAVSGADETVCAESLVFLNGNEPQLNEVGTWSVSPNHAGIVFSDLNDPLATVEGLLPSSVYEFTWTLENGCLSNSDVTIITTNATTGPITAAAGDDQCLLNTQTTFTMDANSPGPGVGLWQVLEKPAGSTVTFTNDASNTTDVTVDQTGTYKLQWSITVSGCDPSIDSVRITVDEPVTIADANIDLQVCGDSTRLAGNEITVGYGIWSQIAGPGGITIRDSVDRNTDVVGLSSGVYEFEWRSINGVCTDADTVKLFVSEPPQEAIAGADIDLCGASSTTLSANTVNDGLWAFISGPNEPTIADITAPNTAISGLIMGDYQLRWLSLSSGPFCEADADTVNISVVPTADAGVDQEYCEDISAVNLAGNVGSTGTWSQISGPNTSTITTTSGNTATASGLIDGTYVFRYEINTGSCSSTDDVEVTLLATPNAADANESGGLDIEYCSDAVSDFALDGNDPAIGTNGLWEKLDGPAGGSFDDDTDPDATFTPAAGAYGTYLFSWTISNGDCSNASQVRVNYYEDPNADAGPDQPAVCGAETTLAASLPPVTGSGEWTVVSTPGAAVPVFSSTESNTPTVSNLTDLGNYTFRWTLSNGTCTDDFDDVIITVQNTPEVADAGPDQELCDVTSTTLAAVEPTGTTNGTWSVVSGPGAPTFDDVNVHDTQFNNLVPGTYVLRWTTSVGGSTCISEDEITIINYEEPTVASTGGDIDLCVGEPLILNGNTPVVGTGTWSQNAGPPVSFLDENDPNTTILGATAGNTYEFQWTITNGVCASSFATMQLTYDEIPTQAQIGANQQVCDSETSTLIVANTPGGGETGTWGVKRNPIGATPGFGDVNDPSTTITGLTVVGEYVFTWTIANTGCETIDSVKIDVLPTVEVTVAPATVLEDAGTDLIFTFTLSGAIDEDLEVPFFVTGDADLTTDYTVTGADSYSNNSGVVTILATTTSAEVTLTPVNNTDIENDETITLTIKNEDEYCVGTNNDATGTIEDDDLDNIRFVLENIQDGEEEGTIPQIYEVTLYDKRDGTTVLTNQTGSDIPVLIDYNFNTITETAIQTDFDPADLNQATINIENGETSQTRERDINDDLIIEITEQISAYLTLAGASPAGSEIGPNSGSGTPVFADVFDNDVPVIEIFTVEHGREGGQDIEYIVRLTDGAGTNLTNGTGTDITFDITYTSPTGATTPDFSSDPFAPVPFLNDVPIADGAGSITYAWDPVVDATIELDTLRATITDPQHATLTPTLGADVADAGIDDDVLWRIAGVQDGNEDNPATEANKLKYFIFVMNSNGDSLTNNTGGPITVDLAYSNDAEVADVVGSFPGTFDIPDGAKRDSLIFTVVDDALIEGTEPLTVTISDPTVGNINVPNATRNIVDDDIENIRFVLTNDRNGVEGGVSQRYRISLVDDRDGTSPLTNATGGSIPIVLNYNEITAVSADFTGGSSNLNSATVNILNGNTTATRTRNINDDLLIENTEQISAYLTLAGGSPLGYVIGPNSGSSTPVPSSVLDNDIPRWEIVNPVNATEGISNVQYTVRLVNASGSVLTNSTGSDMSVGISFSTGSEAVQADFSTTFPTVITLSDGEVSELISLAPVVDLFAEGDEDIRATLVDPRNPSSVSAGPVTISTTNGFQNAIVIDDVIWRIAGVQDGNEDNPSAEANKLKYFIYVLNSAGDSLTNDSGAPITVDLAYSNDAEVADVVGSFPSTFDIPDGAKRDSLIFTVVNDELIEGIEPLTVAISDPTIGSIDVPNATRNIIDDDATGNIFMEISLVQNGSEDGDDVVFEVKLTDGTIDLINDQTTAITADVTFTGSAPNADFDTNISTITSVSFGQGEGTKEIRLEVFDDLLIENLENITATLSNAVGTNPPGPAFDDFNGKDAATADVADNDEPIWEIVNPVDALEGDSDIEYTVRLVNASGDVLTNSTGSDMSVDIAFSTGSEAIQADFSTTFPTTITLADGESSELISLTPIIDLLAEGDEDIRATLQDPRNPSTVSSGTVTISATNGFQNAIVSEEITINVATTQNGSENPNQNIQYTISMINGNGDPVTNATGGDINIETAFVTGSSAVEADITTTFPTDIDIPISNSSYVVDFPVNDDALLEGEELLRITISNPSYGVIDVSTADATLDDDDTAIANLSATRNGNEDDGGSIINIEFTVTLDKVNNTSAPITFEFDDRGTGTATSGDDYTPVPGGAIITVPIGSNTGTREVPVVDDDVSEPVETMTSEIDNPSIPAVTIVIDIATATIIDDDEVTVEIGDVTVNEGDGTVDFTVTLNGDIEEELEVDYTPTDNTALSPSNSDYAYITGTVTFPAGSNDGDTQSITIPITDDNITEPLNETFFMDLSNVVFSGTASIEPGGGRGTATIVDDDEAEIVIVDETVSEADGTATFFVNLLGETQDPFTFNYTTNASGDASVGGDFTTATGTLTFGGPTNDDVQEITVTITNDNVAEPQETFTVQLNTLAAGTQDVTITDAVALGTINDDDEVFLSINDVTEAEDVAGGQMVFTVTLSGGDIQDALSVDYASNNVSALAGAGNDYTAATGTVNFPATSEAGDTQTITININNDGIAEPTETYEIILSNIIFNGDGSISDDTGIGTITDDDEVSITINDQTVAEAALATAEFTVTLSGPIQNNLTIDFATNDVEAISTSSQDYFSNANTITFTGGGALSQQILVSIADDNISEPTETFEVNLSNLVFNGSATIDDTQAIGTITDDDEVSLAIDNVTESEGDALVFTVTLTGNIQDALSVDVATNGTGSATPVSDYTSTTQTLTFVAGSTDGATQTFTVNSTEDAISEPDETFAVLLSNINFSGAIDGGSNDLEGLGTIEDDDAYTLTLGGFTITESEGIQTGNFTVTMSGAAQEDVELHFSTNALLGEAVAGSDFTAQTDTDITIPAGQTIVNIPVTILGDLIAEPTEDFEGTISITSTNGQPITLAPADATATATINDNDAYTLTIAGFTITETEGAQTQNMVVTMSGAAQSDVELLFSTGNNSAESGSDYTVQSGAGYTITAGSTSVNIPIEVLGDAISEPEEDFTGTITIDNDNGQQITIATGTASNTIEDNDQVSIAINDVSVAESLLATAEFTVTLTGAIQDALTFTYATADVEAIVGEDYTTSTNTINFAAGSGSGSTLTISVPVSDDSRAEPTETFELALSNIVFSGAIDNGSNDLLGIGTITDDDAASVSINDVTVDESAGTATFLVRLSGDIQDALTVDYATADDDALSASNQDYSATTGTVTFAAGSVNETQLPIVVNITNDNIAEPTESFEMNLSNLVFSGVGNISDNQGIGTITDNDAYTLTLAGFTVTETDGTQTQNFRVTMSGAAQEDVVLLFSTADNGAEDGTDYQGQAGTVVTIPSGQTVVDIPVDVLGDVIAEATEDFTGTITIDNDNGQQITIATGTATATINDNDAVSISIADVTVNESAGTATFVVTMTGTAQDVFTFDYITNDVDALSTTGQDYTGIGTTQLSFGGVNPSTQNIVVTITSDLVAEPTETFEVNLSNLAAAGQDVTITDDQAIGTITDDDAVSLAIDNVTESEGDALVFTVTLTGNIQDALSVDVATNGTGSATPVSDYTSTTQTLTFVAGSTTGETETFTVNSTEDAIAEPDETFAVLLSNINFSGAIDGGSNDLEGLGTIEDDDAYTLTLGGFTITESEGIQTGNFTVTMSGAAQEDVELHFSTNALLGEAVAGSDFTAQTDTDITIPAGQTIVNIPVTILGDLIAEPTEDFEGTISITSTNGQPITLAPADATATATINDNDAYTLTIAGFTITETEGAQTQNMVVTMSGAAQSDVELLFSTGNNSAESGSDYTVQSGAGYTITAGSTSVNIPIEVLGDAISEPEEDFTGTITIDNDNGQQITIATGTASNTIEDNDQVSIAINDVSVAESLLATAEFTVTLTGAIQDALTFTYATADVEAIVGEDYTTSTNTINFAAGSGSGSTLTISVPVSDDSRAEPTETFELALSNIVFSGAIDNGSNDLLGIGTITDDDAASVSINDVTVDESAGTATFLVRLSGDIQDALTVDYATADDDALSASNQDYSATTGTVTFAAGSVNETQLPIVVNITNDNIAEPTESFEMNLSNLVFSGVGNISDNQGIGTITDNDAYTLTLAGFTVTETDGTQTQNFRVTMSGAAQEDVVLLFSTADNGAEDGTDYTGQAGTVVTIPAGQTVVDIPVGVLGDVIAEATEDFTGTITIDNDNGQQITIATGTATATINDNDAVSISIADVTVNESAGTATFVVTMTGTAQDVFTFDYITNDVDALSTTGQDYTGIGTTQLSFGGVNPSTQNIVVTITSDLVAEPTETFEVNLSNLAAAGQDVTITDDQAIGTITDDDEVSLAIDNVTESEGDALVFTVTLTGNIQDALSVDVATNGTGSATPVSDYTSTTQTLTFVAGSTDGATQTFTVNSTEDAISEPDETFAVLLSNINFSGAIDGGSNDLEGLGTIEDDDAYTLTLGGFTITESEGIQTGNFTVTMSGAAQEDVELHFSTNALLGEAVAGSDFTAQTDTDITIPAGQTIVNIPVTILGDLIAEPTEDFEGTISITSTNGQPITLAPADATATATINDNDAYTLTIAGFTITETEGAQTQNMVVTMSGAAQSDVELLFSTGNNSAESGSDYTVQSGAGYTITAGSTSVNIPIEVLGDAISEPEEDFTGTITIDNDNGQQITIATGTASNTIEDNDQVSIAINDVSVAESLLATAEFTVTLTGAIQDALTFTYATADVEAIVGEDYTTSTNTINFAAGSGSGSTLTISVPVSDDSRAEPTETFELALSNIVFSGAIDNGSNDLLGIGTITDDDAASVSINDVTVDESAGTATFLVRLSGDIQDALTVDYATADDDALSASNQDYSATTGTVTFAAGSVNETQLPIVVNITNDNIAEPTESFEMNLSNLVFSGVGNISDNQGIGTITDNDAYTLTLAGFTVTETDGTQTQNFRVTMSGAAQEDVVLLFSTADNGAEDGTDYQGQAGTVVTIPSGQTVVDIPVDVLGDVIAEATEDFTGTITIDNDNGQQITIATGTATATINDNDAVSISIADVTVNESAGTATFVVTMTGTAQDVFTFDYITNDVDALSTTGQDYTGIGTTQLSFGGVNPSTQNIVVTITSDLVAEPTETFEVNLSNLAAAGQDVTITDDQAIGTITDDDAVSLAIDNVTESEGDALVFTVTLTGNIQDALSVDVATNGTGSATPVSDYTSTTQTLTFVAGSTTGETETFTVNSTEDAIAEPDETFAVLLSNINFSGAIDGGSNDLEGLGTIEDDDAYTLTLGGFTITETNGTQTGNFTVTMSGAAQEDVELHFSTSVTGLAGVNDFDSQTDTDITIPAGQTIVNIPVTILGDLIAEPTEDFEGTISITSTNGQPITLAPADATATATINDNDAYTLTIAGFTIAETEGAQTQNMVVTMSGAAQSDVELLFSTGNNSAESGSDYTVQSGAGYTITAGSTSVNIPIEVLGDAISEPEEDFTGTITIANDNGQQITIATGVATNTIEDNDQVSIAINDVSVAESALATAEFTVTLTGAIQDALTFTYATADGEALNGEDYTTSTNTINFAAGSGSGSTLTVTVPVSDDSRAEPTETFELALSNIVFSGAIDNGSNDLLGIGTITDDDAASVSINDVTVDESAGTATFLVRLSGDIQDALTVDYATADDDALSASNQDYSATTGTVTFAAGSLNETQLPIVVNITNDNIAEPTESFEMNLSNLVFSGVGSISDNQGIGTITDNDAYTLTLAGFTVTETDGTQTQNFRVTMSGAAQEDVVLLFSTADNGAEDGTDYTGQAGTVVTIPAGQTVVDIPVDVLGDVIAEATEDFTGTITIDNENGQQITIATGTATATINDNDAYTLSIAGFTITETEGTQTQNMTVTMSGVAQADVNLLFSTSNNSALSGSDYTAQSGESYTITAGNTSVDIPLEVLGDVIAEPTEDFTGTITLDEVNGQQITIATGTASNTINDNDAFTLTLTGFTVAETDATQIENFTVTMSGEAQEDVVLIFNTNDVSASEDDDYIEEENTIVTIPAGSTSVDIPVSVLGDDIAEPTEDFSGTITLDEVNGQQVTILTGTATSTVTDDDAYTLTLTGFTVAETNGSQTQNFRVTMSGAAQEDVLLNFSTTDDTAIDGTDHTAQAGTLVTIAAGNTSVNIPVEILGDVIAEPTEEYTAEITLNDVSGQQVTIATATATATITDNDAYTLTIAGFTITETEGAQTQNMVVTMSGIAQADVDLLFSTGDNSALVGSDYAVQSNVGYTITAGSTSVNIPVEVLGDVISEPTEDFTGTITLDEVNGQQITIATGSASNTINDNDANTISITGFTITETDANQTANFTVEMTGIAQEDVDLIFNTDNLSATAGNDFTGEVNTEVTITAGTTTINVPVEIIGDLQSEPTETFRGLITIDDVNGQLITITTGGAIGTIEDNDIAEITLSGFSITETGTSQTANFTLSSTRSFNQDLEFSISTTDASARSGSDYVALTGRTVILPANDLTVTIPVTIEGDLTVEPTETFTGTITLVEDNGQQLTIVQNTATGQILDTDVATVSIDDVTVLESEGVAVFTVVLEGDVQDGFTFRYATSEVTALEGVDFGEESGILSFNSETSNVDEITISIPIINDALIEPDETFEVRLSNIVASSPGISFADNTGIGTIRDDDTNQINFTVETSSNGSEDGDEVVFTVKLVDKNGNDITNQTEDEFTIQVDFSGSALPEDIDTLLISELVFGPGEGIKTITLPIEDDLLIEGDETIRITLSEPSDNVGINTGSDFADAIIEDNDDLDLIVDLVKLRDGSEDGQTADFALQLKNAEGDALINATGSAITTNVSYSGSAGTEDIESSLPNLLSVANDASETVYALLVNDDNLIEGSESLNLAIVDPSLGVLGDSEIEINIEDNDTPTSVTAESTSEVLPEDTPLICSPTNGTGLVIDDEDSDIQTLIIDVDNGVLTINEVPGVEITGNGTDRLTITGTPTDINEALDGAVFQPDVDFTGEAAITLNVEDEDGSEDTEVVVIDVQEFRDIEITVNSVCINDVPYVEYAVTAVNFEFDGPVTIQWVKMDGEIAEELSGQPAEGLLLWPGAEVDGNGNALDWPGWELEDGIWVQVEDGLRPEMQLVITANPTNSVVVSYPPATPNCAVDPNNPPVADDPTMEVEDPVEGIEDTLLPFVDEPDGDNLTFTLVDGPDRGELTLNPDGTFTYIPELGDEGEVEFEYQVCDDGNPALCDVGTVTLVVPPLEGSDPGCESALPYACEDFPVNMVITPNFDGFNDFLEIKGVEFYPNTRVVVYNRWGNLVWEGEGYDNVSQFFEGLANSGALDNSQLPDGTYFYIIERRDGTDYPLQKGFVHLQR